jgi:hypothetical protein
MATRFLCGPSNNHLPWPDQTSHESLLSPRRVASCPKSSQTTSADIPLHCVLEQLHVVLLVSMSSKAQDGVKLPQGPQLVAKPPRHKKRRLRAHNGTARRPSDHVPFPPTIAFHASLSLSVPGADGVCRSHSSPQVSVTVSLLSSSHLTPRPPEPQQQHPPSSAPPTDSDSSCQ